MAMNLREATTEDVDKVRSVAQESLSSSYTHVLDDETIDDAVQTWYGESLADDLEGDDVLVFVAEEDDEIIGFAQSELFGNGQTTGQIRWIHVGPDHRGGGIGLRLLARMREELLEAGADHIRATVLEENEMGNEFYAANGFERSGTTNVEIGEETHTENVFVESDSEGDEWRGLEEVSLEEETIYVSYGEAVRGAKAPFYTAYQHEDEDQRYGWFCGNCDSLDNAMDSMGRIECNACGNQRKATRWDASYL